VHADMHLSDVRKPEEYRLLRKYTSLILSETDIFQHLSFFSTVPPEMKDMFQCCVIFNGDVCHKMKLFANSIDMQKKTSLQRINSTTTSRHPTVNNLSQTYSLQTVHPQDQEGKLRPSSCVHTIR